MTTVDMIPAPGTVFDLAVDVGGVVYAAARISIENRQIALLRLEGDRLVETGFTASTADYAILHGAGGPWWLDGAFARAIASGEERDLTAIFSGEETVKLAIHEDAWFAASVANVKGGDPGVGRARRVDASGAVVWTTDLGPGLLAFEGVQEMRADRGWLPEPMPAWKPRNWMTAGRPIVTGELVVVSFIEPDSGLGIWYGLAAEDGRVLWATPPRPLGDASVFADGAVAIGSQGYGAFESELRARYTDPLARWPSQGKGLAIDGALVVVEMDNAGADRRHLVRWHLDGSIDQGARLPGYYTSDPVLRADGTILFARGESLWSGDGSLAITEIAKLGKQSWSGRTVVLADGTVLLTDLEARIWRVR